MFTLHAPNTQPFHVSEMRPWPKTVRSASSKCHIAHITDHIQGVFDLSKTNFHLP
jgi:hypothetical protein